MAQSCPESSSLSLIVLVCEHLCAASSRQRLKKRPACRVAAVVHDQNPAGGIQRSQFLHDAAEAPAGIEGGDENANGH
jgi:hypothetical protein